MSLPEIRRERGAAIILSLINALTEALYKHKHKWTDDELLLHDRALRCLGIPDEEHAIHVIRQVVKAANERP
jgi:hypothetical protein